MKKILILALFLTFSYTQILSAQPAGRVTMRNIRIEEEDGSPSGVARKIKVTNSSLTDNGGGSWSLDVSGAVGSGDIVTANSNDVDTTANFLDDDVIWSITDGGAGGPDDITGGINWTNMQEEVQTGNINWTSIENDEIQSGGFNWTSVVEEIGDSAINWEDIDNEITADSINWAAIQSQNIFSQGINWIDINVPTDEYYATYEATGTGIEWVAGGAGATAFDDIADPDAASSISFDDGETVTFSTAEDSAGSFMTINNTDADLAANTYLLDLDYSVDDDQANADYFKCQDAGGTVFAIQQDGDTEIYGDLAVGSNAHPSIEVNGTTKYIQFGVHGDDDANTYVAYMDRASDTHSPTLAIVRARGSHGAPTQVIKDDILGQIGFFGWDDTDNDLNLGATISAVVHDDAGNNDLPTELIFAVTPDGAATPTQQVNLYDGVFAPITDDDIDLGASATQFKDGYFNGTIEGDVITEGGNAVYSSGETPSGVLGGTYADITIDDLSVQTGTINWTSIYNIADTNLNWTDFAVPDASINWTLAVPVYEADESVDTSSEIMAIVGADGVQNSNINWVSIQEIADTNLNWTDFSTPDTAINWTLAVPVYETNNLEADGAADIADTELYIGTGAGTGNYAAMSGDGTLSNAGILGINWVNMPDEVQSANVNWSNLSADIETAAINWVSVENEEMQTAGINWASVQSQQIYTQGINWVDINSPTDEYYATYEATGAGIEWVQLVGGGDLKADGTVPLTDNWDVGNYDITLKALTGDGTIEGATLTEGGEDVYNSTETPGGVLGGTWAAPTLDSLAVQTGNINWTSITDDINTTQINWTAIEVLRDIQPDAINWEVGTDPDVDYEGESSWDSSNNARREYDGTNQVVSGRKDKEIELLLAKPDDISSNNAMIIWKNISGFIYNITRIFASSTTDDTTFNLERVGGTANTVNWIDVDIIEPMELETDGAAGGGVTWYSGNVATGINWTTIPNENYIGINWTSAVDPDLTHIKIQGWYNADVD